MRYDFLGFTLMVERQNGIEMLMYSTAGCTLCVLYVCVANLWQTAFSKIIEKSNQRLKLHAGFQQLNATDCTQIF